MTARRILVTGATGHQGRSLIRALGELPHSADSNFHVLALTRTVTSPAAQRLAAEHGKRIQLVEGDLDTADSIRKIFEDAKEDESGGIWGVFCVLAYPGMGVNADGEERQGKMLADLSLQYGVSCFVLSTSDRAGEYFDNDIKILDRIAKIRIERHVKELGSKGLQWTILRPGFFMENYDGFLGAITVGVLKAGLKPTTTNRMVAVDDIGYVAAAVFESPAKYASQILTMSMEVSTMSEQDEQYKRATGKAMPTIPKFLAKAVIMMNGHTRELIDDLERMHNARQNGLCPEVEAQSINAKDAYPGMKSLQAWAECRKNGSVQQEANWNKVSLLRLVTGRL